MSCRKRGTEQQTLSFKISWRVSYIQREKKKSKRKGILKSHLIEYCGLKASTAEKYLAKLENAGYIVSRLDTWGDRTIIVYQITPKGRERYQWFVKINTEMEEIE